MTAGAPATRSSASLAERIGPRLAQLLPPIIVFVVLIGLWEVFGKGTLPQPLSAPSAIAGALIDNSGLLMRAARATLFEAMGGLFIGTSAGLIMAFAASRFIVARDILMPIAIGAAAIPLVAMAPIFNNWFGLVNPMSKMAMAALLVFFPVFISSTRGLVEVSPGSLELMRSYATSDTEVLRKVRIPNMLPFFFTALKVGTTLAFIGAIVAEYFGGTSEVVGRVVLNAMFSGKFALGWAAILLGAVAAIVAYLIVSAIERRAIPWYISLREDGG
ncbi:MAG: ABC transporter permease [Chloroflexota bacterium]